MQSVLNIQLKRQDTPGILLVGLLAIAATFLANIPAVSKLGVSPLITGIILGIITGNTVRGYIPSDWAGGIKFSAKIILRTAIILYGFKITFQQIAQVGLPGLLADLLIVSSTFLIGSFVGIRFLKMDPETAYLTSSGASICGAAAVLATEPVVKAEPHKTAIAVATVVLFGTTSMFLYPILYRMELLGMAPSDFGIFLGSTVHEVAQVVAAGNAVSEATAETAVIVKMTRVMLLAPVLLLLGLYLARKNAGGSRVKTKLPVPWFVLGFIAVAAFNSLKLIPTDTVATINKVDIFLLTMAMTALGLETNASRLKVSGGKPVLLAFILFLWLAGGGYLISSMLRMVL